MASARAARAIIAACISIGVAALGVTWLAAASSGAGQPATVEVIAIDADPTGNSPRTVGTVEDCLSTTVGQPVDIDIVVPSPGIPLDRGTVAYQFSIFYDPAIVWIGADDASQLLKQAEKSSVWPIADPKPDKDGFYQSWAVDFGPKAIEPTGASETGPGVIARVTLIPQDTGASPLILKDVLIADHASQPIAVDSVLSATINVGQPCPGQSLTSPSSPPATPAPAASTPSPAATRPSSASDPPLSAQGTLTPTTFSDSGGPPPPDDGSYLWLIAIGLITALGGASLLVGSNLSLSEGAHRPESPHEDRVRQPPSGR